MMAEGAFRNDNDEDGECIPKTIFFPIGVSFTCYLLFYSYFSCPPFKSESRTSLTDIHLEINY